MKLKHDPNVRMIPVSSITIVNSRSRGKSKFKQIVANISSIGLKKPITVALRDTKDGEPRYDLVCGQGRLEAFMALGQTHVPALVVEANREDLLLMGLAENLARRQRTTIELAREIMAMKDRGYKPAEIAKKVDLDLTYVLGILRLLKQGEERLIVAVEHKQIPLSLAVAISESGDQDVQNAMTEAYEKGELRGKALLAARRLIERRRTRGKSVRGGSHATETVTSHALLKAYRKEASRQQMLVGRANVSETRLRFVVSAMKRLLSDEAFVNLLRAESLGTVPQYLADRVRGEV